MKQGSVTLSLGNKRSGETVGKPGRKGEWEEGGRTGRGKGKEKKGWGQTREGKRGEKGRGANKVAYSKQKKTTKKTIFTHLVTA